MRIAAGHHPIAPCWSMLGIEFCFDVGEKTLRCTEFHWRGDSVRAGPVEAAVEHGAGRSATVIANAEQMHQDWRAGVQFLGDGDVACDSGWLNLIYVVVREI